MTQSEKMNWLNHKIDNAYDMTCGAMNRVCITEDDTERDKMLESIKYHTEKLVEFSRCRAHKCEGFDEVYVKYTRTK